MSVAGVVLCVTGVAALAACTLVRLCCPASVVQDVVCVLSLAGALGPQNFKKIVRGKSYQAVES